MYADGIVSLSTRRQKPGPHESALPYAWAFRLDCPDDPVDHHGLGGSGSLRRTRSATERTRFRLAWFGGCYQHAHSTGDRRLLRDAGTSNMPSRTPPTPSGGDPGREGAARFPRWGSQCHTGGCRRGRCERFAQVTSSRRGARMRDRDADRGRSRRSRGAMSSPAYRRCLRPDMLRAAGRRGAGLRLTPRWSGYRAGPTGPM
jgi:hypothetical protein